MGLMDTIRSWFAGERAEEIEQAEELRRDPELRHEVEEIEEGRLTGQPGGEAGGVVGTGEPFKPFED